MQRIEALTDQAADGKAAELLDAVKRQLGGVPNILATMARGPAALDAYLKLSSALGGGSLSPALREQIALAVAGANGCDYCASAHTAIGAKLGLAEDEIDRNLAGRASDAGVEAALTFARRLVATRGRVSDADLDAIRAAGFGDGEVVEIVANVALNLFTNYFNHVADTEIDFPVVRAGAEAAA